MTPAKLISAVGCSATLAALYASHLEEACNAFGINTDARLAAFLAQVGHESGSFRYNTELASGRAYEGRHDLGNTQPGDGPRFRGHGLIQITGRANHVAVRGGLANLGCPDFEADPEALAQPRWAALSAGWFWSKHGCNELADSGQFETITRRINGGLNGQSDRLARWERAKAALAAQHLVLVSPATPEEQPAPAPNTQQEPSVPFLIPALSAIMQAIPTLAAKWGGDASVVAQRNVAIAQTVVEAVKTATGSVNEQELTEKLASDPAAVQQAHDAVQAIWWQIDATGAGAAREADAKFVATGSPVWRSPSFLATICMLPLVYMIIGSLVGLFGHLTLSEAVTGNILTGVITLIIGGSAGYYYGATTSANKPGASAQ